MVCLRCLSGEIGRLSSIISTAPPTPSPSADRTLCRIRFHCGHRRLSHGRSQLTGGCGSRWQLWRPSAGGQQKRCDQEQADRPTPTMPPVVVRHHEPPTRHCLSCPPGKPQAAQDTTVIRPHSIIEVSTESLGRGPVQLGDHRHIQALVANASEGSTRMLCHGPTKLTLSSIASSVGHCSSQTPGLAAATTR